MVKQKIDFEFQELIPAGSLQEIRTVFDPTFNVDPRSPFYISRRDTELQKLVFDLKQTQGYFYAFLCGHRGSGKSTELRRICLDPEILEKYLPVFISAKDFGSELVHLTHDALLVEIGLALVKTGHVSKTLCKELDSWGLEVVKTFLKGEQAQAEVGAKADAWFAYFKAQLATRREWKTEERQILEPRVQDLIGILNRMAVELKNHADKSLLVIVDDLEKGESDAHKQMYLRIFQECYEILTQPRFTIIYTLPVYFRAIPGSRIPNDELYAFPACRLYPVEEKAKDLPELDRDCEGYKLMRKFVESRLKSPDAIPGEELDELLLIGGGLFRETARAIREAAYFAIVRGGGSISMEDVRQVFNQIKKEYQPMIRGEAVNIMKAALECKTGWVEGVEPYLQSRAVVEYENGDLWLEVRHVLKSYVRGLPVKNG
jgi:hypothetical protein